jgi:hypothetical protein
MEMPNKSNRTVMVRVENRIFFKRVIYCLLFGYYHSPAIKKGKKTLATSVLNSSLFREYQPPVRLKNGTAGFLEPCLKSISLRIGFPKEMMKAISG